MGAERAVVAPQDVRLFPLFSGLWRLATEKSGGEGFKDDVECPFTAKEIEGVLRRLHIEDTAAGLKVCVQRHWFVQQKDGTYRLGRGALSTYNLQRAHLHA